MAEPETPAVLIPHPTEELIFAKLQKELISDFFEEGRILYAVKPLWIQITGDASSFPEKITAVELSDLEAGPREIFIPVTIMADGRTITSKVSLVKIHSGNEFTTPERKGLYQKKQPVKKMKIFRLGKVKSLSAKAECLTGSKWFKLK